MSIAIKIFSLFPGAVERYYSDGIYPVISQIQRLIFGWLPFSIGDILYGIIFLYLLYKMIGFSKRVAKKQTGKKYLLHVASRIVFAALLVYVTFNLLWGLNYNRIGIAKQLQLQTAPYSNRELMIVMEVIIHRINEVDSLERINRLAFQKKRRLFSTSITAYHQLAEQNRLFSYSYPSIKPSLYSYLGNYLGFTGYYNPFSGEAQVNTTVPVYIRPFTTCHEIGHQLGYAKESEANFAGYLSAKTSHDPSFRYSAYFDLYLYGRRYVYLADSLAGKQLDNKLNAGVRKDIRELRAFFDRHANPIETIIDVLYSQFLKANQQPSGRISYNEVIGWVIAYYKKFGTI